MAEGETEKIPSEKDSMCLASFEMQGHRERQESGLQELKLTLTRKQRSTTALKSGNGDQQPQTLPIS